ncbi:MAG: sugar-binding domain-containing protein [Alistipes sp.]
MRFITTVISILCVVSLSAQVRYSFDGDKSVGKEPARRETLPYNKTRVVAGDKDEYAYIAIPTAWQIAKSEGETVYDSQFTMPVSWLNRQVLLRVGRSSSAFGVAVNGKRVGYAPSGAVGAEFNLTKYVRKGRNTLQIVLYDDARVNAIFTSLPSGIADVKVICQPTIRVRDIFCKAALESGGKTAADIGIVVKCDALGEKRSRIEYVLRFRDSVVLAEGYRDIRLDMLREDTVHIRASVPKEALWSAADPNLLCLEIINRIDGRIAESISRNVGVRTIEIRNNALYINGRIAPLRLAEYNSDIELQYFKASGFNGIIAANGMVPSGFYDECDRLGIYVVSASAIDTEPFADSVKRDGNPCNLPEWHDTFLSRNEDNYLVMHSHPSVVGYIICRGKGTGINVYESYLLMKRLEPASPIIYEAANGEWCTDKIKFR